MTGRSNPYQRLLDEHFEAGLEWARWAVERWSGFPVDADPRPLVLVGARVDIDGGFATEGAKEAYLAGRIDWRVSAPGPVMAQLRSQGDDVRPSAGRPLVVTAAELSEREFRTDRGPRRLPAWRLTATGACGPIWILDPDVAGWEPSASAGGPRPKRPSPGGNPWSSIAVAPDGRAVTVHWFGAVPAFERYHSALAIESMTAVAFVARGRDIGPPGARTLAGHIHQVPASLREPLGNRVFVSLRGHAGEVRARSVPPD